MSTASGNQETWLQIRDGPAQPNWIVPLFCVGMHYLHMEAPVKVIHRDLKSRNGKVAKHWNALHLLLPVNVAFKSVPELCEQAELTNALVVIKAALVEAQKSLFPPPSPEPVWSSLQTWHYLEHCGGLFQLVSCWPWLAISSAFRRCLGTSHFFFLFGKVEYQERLADTRHNRLDKAYYFLSENLVFTVAFFGVWQILRLLSNTHWVWSLYLAIDSHFWNLLNIAF